MHEQFIAIRIVALAVFGTAFADAADYPSPKFEHQEIDKIQIGYGLAVGDVDGDKKDDILLADKQQFVWYRNPGKRGESWKRFVMVENLTARDNVCLAAHDIDGDGKVEVAVGAMWNPGETSDPALSGSVHYLLRPGDPTQKWKPVKLHHEPTVHRMRWVKMDSGQDRSTYQLVVLPLHGRGNKGGEGEGVKVLAYEVPEDRAGKWKTIEIDNKMHLTHNFDVVDFQGTGGRPQRGVLIVGKEGIRAIMYRRGEWKTPQILPSSEHAAGEVRGRPTRDEDKPNYIATIEPMHGNSVVVYSARDRDREPSRTVLDDTLNQGHALAIADVLGMGRPQVIAGWRNPDKEKKVGIKLYVPLVDDFTKFERHVIDDNQMACEDLTVSDLDGDGRLDIVAAGRATRNVKIYWNVTREK